VNLLFEKVEETAAQIAAQYGLSFLPGTSHIMIVKETKTHLVCIYQTVFNWRLARIPLRDLSGFDAAWCYTGEPGFGIALGQAAAWPDDDDGTHTPLYWYRDLNTDTRQQEYLFT
jgi:hypothetical protein